MPLFRTAILPVTAILIMRLIPFKKNSTRDETAVAAFQSGIYVS
jgi:hypothetical protein